MIGTTWKNRYWLRKMIRRCQISNDSSTWDHEFYPERHFKEKLIQERKRAERSNKPLLVMVIDPNTSGLADRDGGSRWLCERLHHCVRHTDICGVLKPGSLFGVILTEVEPEKISTAQMIVAEKTRAMLASLVNEETARQIVIDFRIFPVAGGPLLFDMTFYPELFTVDFRVKAGEIVKRALDVLGSIVGLILFSPFFITLPIFIKFSSKGPVLFLQDRIGRNGTKFKLLKFRSMYLDNDDVIHREYVTKLINGQISASQGVFKIQFDPRITPVGRCLRKYSLDELPQFINVLKGDMSLVGPRPPIRYEVENYAGWQRNRLMGKRPGITGLWQVTGRSSTSFDEMVRLDLKYLTGWSIMLDIKILLRTPLAVFKAKGAY
ncbi:sugar transferase [Geomonas silvestris]|uniref:sugar transferase n=1 Tax=Geomonas silvestris TaxID=2740184 RepID=UPI0018E0BE2E|nr:sugar transferase [Geomonas silvestris]